MSDEKKKRGRPAKGNTKNNVVAMRVDDETRDALYEICEHYNISKSDLLKKMVQTQHNFMENGIDFL